MVKKGSAHHFNKWIFYSRIIKIKQKINLIDERKRCSEITHTHTHTHKKTILFFSFFLLRVSRCSPSSCLFLFFSLQKKTKKNLYYNNSNNVKEMIHCSCKGVWLTTSSKDFLFSVMRFLVGNEN